MGGSVKSEHGEGLKAPPGFKPCKVCHKVCLPTPDPHDSCFKCLGIAHDMDACQYCLTFEPGQQRRRFVRHLLWRKKTE